MEMELKLLLDPKARRLVDKHPAFRAVKAQKRKATTVYFDTANLDLFRLGASFRVRRLGKADFVQTVKLHRPDDRVGLRGEWEWSLASAEPDLGRLASLPDEAAAIRHVADRLRPLFTTTVERTSRLLKLDGATVEAVIDEGVIRAGIKSLAISEVELELKAGAVGPVFHLAIDLVERFELRFGPQSKSDRGYTLVADRLPERMARTLPPWDEANAIGVVFPRLVHAALQDIADDIPSVSAHEVEGVHRMRAAIRKLRSILVLFAPYLRRRPAKAFNAALRHLGSTLGQARDWDVFLTETLARAEAKDEHAVLGLLRSPAERRSAAAHAAVGKTMQGHLLTGLILGMGAWTSDNRWIRKVDARSRFADLVPDLLDELDAAVNTRIKKLDMPDAERLHDLRKALKKLRYSVEDVGSLFDRDAVDAYLHALKGILALLGDINDAEVTEHRVEDLVSAKTPELVPAATELLHQTGERRSKAARKLPKKLANFQAITPFWR